MTREEAIMILKNEQPHCGKIALFSEEKKYEAFDMAIKALEQEPKTGHWIDGVCSECGYIGDEEVFGGKFKYCPVCGAVMRGEHEND